MIGTAKSKNERRPGGCAMRLPGRFFVPECRPVNFCAERPGAFVAQERLVCYNNTVIMGLQAKNVALQANDNTEEEERQGACAGIGH